MDVSCSPDTTLDTGNFECNICFELAQEPIVTLCGHLYCWPCLYQWLQLHSHSHECPVCKAFVPEEKLIPIYGRSNKDVTPRSRPTYIPFRPMGQRLERPHVDTNYTRSDDLDPMGFMPMAAARIGHMTLSTIFGVLPGILNFQLHGYHDSSVYGSTSGFPYLFSSSFHGGYVHGFHYYHSGSLEWKPIAWKIAFAVLGCLILLRIILA